MNNNGGFETNNLIDPNINPLFQLDEIHDNHNPWFFDDQTPPPLYSSLNTYSDYTDDYNFGSGFSTFGSETQLGVPSFTPDFQFYPNHPQNGFGSPEIQPIGQPNLPSDPPAAVEQPNLVQNTGNLMIIDYLDMVNANYSDNLNPDHSDGINEEMVIENGDGDDVAGEGGGGDGCGKGKRKYPAKNVEAERRRRENLNNKLVILRSKVPKITKMDRASIISDAIAYIKDLRQQVNDLDLERESSLWSLKLQPAVTTGLDSLSVATTNVPSYNKKLKEKVFPDAIKIEVRQREDGVVNIHMFCDRKPAGLLHSITTTIDSLGLEIQEAVFSSFNSFALDVFRAEKMSENQVNPDQIKAKLMESVGFHVVG